MLRADLSAPLGYVTCITDPSLIRILAEQSLIFLSRFRKMILKNMFHHICRPGSVCVETTWPISFKLGMVSLQYFRELILVSIYFEHNFAQGSKGKGTFALLGCHAAWISSQLPTFRDILSVPWDRYVVPNRR